MNDCKICDHKRGLSILLVRPSAIASDAEFAPAEAERLETHEPSVKALGLPALQKSRYALRMLRRGGFVHIFYTKQAPHILNRWQVYRVQGNGALIPESQVAWAAKPDFACRMRESHPNDVRTVCIQFPRHGQADTGPVWIGFSMNWWDDAMRKKVEAHPGAAGMVRIDPMADLGGVPHAFKADTELIHKHVADFALRSMSHGGIKKGINFTEGGVASATPFYGGTDDETYRGAARLVAVMQKQAAQHEQTRGKEFVLVVPDPVGLAADLNGIRIAREKASQQKWASTPDWVRSEACHTLLEGMRKSITLAGVIQSQEWGTAASEKQWRSIKDRGVPYEWTPDPRGVHAEDGSRAGHMKPIGPDARTIGKRLDRRGVTLGALHWEKITDQLDMGRYKAWPAKRAGIEKQLAEALAPYEADWLKVLDSNALRDYFKLHFNEDASSEMTARTSPGFIYASESHIAHFPQPYTHQHTERWTGLILDPDIAEPRAIALRGFFGNQRSVIQKVRAILIGNADRSATPAKDGQGEIGDIRDKTYDVLKGLITHDMGKRLNWLHPRLMALSAGGMAASAAGVFQLMAMAAGKSPAPKSGSLRKYEAMLPALSAAQRQLELVCESTRPGGDKSALSTVVLLKTRVSSDTAMRILSGYVPKKSPTIIVAHGDTVELQVLTDVKTALDVREGRLKAEHIPGQRVGVAPTGGPAARSLEDLQLQMARLQVNHALTPDDVAEVMRRQSMVKELNLTSIDGRLAVGAMIVQFLGLYQAVPQMLAELGKSQRDQAKLVESTLSVVDGMSGFIGATLERMAAAHKAALVVKDGGEHLVEASGRLAAYRVGAALFGMLSGAIMAYSMNQKADGARNEGDRRAAQSYLLSSVMGGGLVLTSGITAADAITKGTVTRAIGKHVLLRLAGVVATEAAVAGAAATVVSIVSGVGLALLVAGVAAYVYAVVTERDSYMRWAGRCYFGKDTVKRFESASAEENWLLAIDYEIDTQEDVRRKAQQYPDPGRSSPPPSIPMVDGLGGGLML